MTLALLDMIDAAHRTGQDAVSGCIGQIPVTESRRFEAERILVSLDCVPQQGQRPTPMVP